MFNLIGIVLYINLGCVLLFDVVVQVVICVMIVLVDLEFDIIRGCWGDCDVCVQVLVCELIGVEVVIVVNNNVVVVLLLFNSLVNCCEVVVLCGELVEIGGVFCIFDVMCSVGVWLLEVGIINCIYLVDFVYVIGVCIVLLMEVYVSNYVIIGFIVKVDIVVMVVIVYEYGLLLVVDLGSGSLCDLVVFGLLYEFIVQEVLVVGVDLVLFSGDKLLGGFQVGIIVGCVDLIVWINCNLFKCVLCMDKMGLVVLEVVLVLYCELELLVLWLLILCSFLCLWDDIDEQV